MTRPLVPAVNRAVEILDLVAAERGQLGVSAIARRLGLPKSSVANLCGALTDTGMLRLSVGGYTLGQHLAQLGASYVAGIDHAQLFHESCATLDAARNDTVQLAMLSDELEVIYLARREGVNPVRLASTLGTALPATCTATGKAILARLGRPALDERLGRNRLVAMTRHSITSVAAFRREIDEIRTIGHAVDREEVIEGVVCVGVALPGPDPSGQWLAVSATLLAPRATDALIARIAAELHVVARSFSFGLGRPAEVAHARDPLGTGVGG